MSMVSLQNGEVFTVDHIDGPFRISGSTTGNLVCVLTRPDDSQDVVILAGRFVQGFEDCSVELQSYGVSVYHVEQVYSEAVSDLSVVEPVVDEFAARRDPVIAQLVSRLAALEAGSDEQDFGLVDNDEFGSGFMSDEGPVDLAFEGEETQPSGDGNDDPGATGDESPGEAVPGSSEGVTDGE